MTFDDWLAIVRAQTAARDDGGAAHGPWTFDEVSQQWTQGIVPDEVLRLRAQLAAAQAELARMRVTISFKPSFPARALGFARQDVGLRLPVGF